MKNMTAKPATECAASFLSHQENRTIRKALDILEARFFELRVPLTRPDDVADFLRLQLAGNKHEVFAVIFLDTLNRLISFEEMFYGSISSCTVHPREIVKSALAHNSAAVILCHNHPSGSCLPSGDDLSITKKIKEVLKVVDVQVLDHFIVGCGEPYSLATHGQI